MTSHRKDRKIQKYQAHSGDAEEVVYAAPGNSGERITGDKLKRWMKVRSWRGRLGY